MLKEVPWNQGEAPWEVRGGDEVLQQEYLNNRPHILRPDQLGQVTAQYNCSTNDFSGGMTEILKIMRNIILQQQRAFKLYIALGFIMCNVSTGEYRYFIPYANKPLLNRNVTISSMKDFRKLKVELQRSDITNNVNLSRPNSSWKIDFVTNMVMYVYRTSYTMGWGRLPEYIKNNPNIVALDSNTKIRGPFMCLPMPGRPPQTEPEGGGGQRILRQMASVHGRSWKELAGKL